MATLTSAKRAKMPASKFAGPGRSFPVNDPTHARLAIGGATRSANAGNISQSQAATIKAKARAELGENPGNPGNGTAPKRRRPDNPPMAPRGPDFAGNSGNPGPIATRNDMPGRPRYGATDGMGGGKGGLAVHSSLSGHNIDGYEPQHTSRTR